MDEQLITIAEAARLLGVHPDILALRIRAAEFALLNGRLDRRAVEARIEQLKAAGHQIPDPAA